jgi:2-polyprenyl-3-methyl-5-hydroxy-6-metoxy-1,4-benzoquinol methylase
MQKSVSFINRSWEMEERSWWDLWNSSFRSEDSQDDNATALFTHVLDVFRNITNGRSCRVLEVACGTGTLSRLLSFSSYHGLDISAAAIDIARKKTGMMTLAPGGKAPVYEAADFHDWPLLAEPFDVALCVDAISCFRDQALVMLKIAQSVKPGGYVLITTINPIVYNRIRRADGGRLQNGPVSHWLPARELHGLIRQAGLNIERSYTIMPRGNIGILRLVNSWRLNRALGPRGAAIMRRWKEMAGLGQYRVVLARKLNPA